MNQENKTGVGYSGLEVEGESILSGSIFDIFKLAVPVEEEESNRFDSGCFDKISTQDKDGKTVIEFNGFNKYGKSYDISAIVEIEPFELKNGLRTRIRVINKTQYKIPMVVFPSLIGLGNPCLYYEYSA